MDIRKLQKMVGMYVKVDWRQYFDENTSPAVQSYITKNADSLYPWLYDIIKHAISKKLDEVAIIKFIDSKMYATIKKEDSVSVRVSEVFKAKVVQLYVVWVNQDTSALTYVDGNVTSARLGKTSSCGYASDVTTYVNPLGSVPEVN